MDDNINMSLDSEFTGLVFNDTIDTSNMTNILLIDSIVADKQQFYDSVNANTFPVIYSYNSSTDELLALFRQKFPASSIQRISLVFHDRGPNVQAPFMNNKIFFEEADLEVNQTNFTENVSFLISCIKEFHMTHIDFLACNTLQYSNWKNYYALLASQTAVVVGASNDPTGNLKYGGNWIMESTGQDIKETYFTDSINYYKYLLVDYTLNGIQYTFTSATTADVTGYNLGITIANIPSTITPGTTYNVTGIGNNAFKNCATLTSVTIPNSVATIGSEAFYACTSLPSITIPNSVATIGDSAFSNSTSLTEINVDVGNLNYINDAFGALFDISQTTLIQYPVGNTRTTYTIPGLVITIARNAFIGCASLTDIIIPSSVTTINSYAFESCTALSSISIPNSVSGFPGEAQFRFCTGLVSVTLPTNVAFTAIPYYAFKGCSLLNSITIPNFVSFIGKEAFFGCSSLVSVTLPTNVAYTTIVDGTFQYCTSLTSITIPNSVTTIQDSSFYGCSSLSALSIPSSVTSIQNNAFYNCSMLNIVYFLQTFSIPTIGTDAFENIYYPSVGKYYSSVSNASSLVPFFNSISPISNSPPTLTYIIPFTGTENVLSVISYSDLVTNGNEVVDNPPFVFLVQSISSGSLKIGATQGTATPWNASTNKTINASNNAYWIPPTGVSGLVSAFSVVVQDWFGNVSSPNVQVNISLTAIYSVSYDGNTNTSGSAPVDGLSPYEAGSSVSVLGNTGSLAKTCFTFAGWNTLANGTGTAYSAGDTFTINANTILYAQWSPIPYTITYNGNTNTSGTAPVDGLSPYNCGSSVSVLGNTGSLAKTCFTFTGWNTLANGAGTAYSPTTTFTIYANTILYAQWELINTTRYCPVPKIKGLYYPSQEQLYRQFKNENCNIQKKLPGTLGGRYVGALSGAMRKSQWIGLGAASKGQTRFVLNADELGMREGQPGGILAPIRNRF